MNPTKCNLKVNSPHVQYTDEAIETNYEYPITSVSEEPETGTYFVSGKIIPEDYRFKSIITANSTPAKCDDVQNIRMCRKVWCDFCSAEYRTIFRIETCRRCSHKTDVTCYYATSA